MDAKFILAFAATIAVMAPTTAEANRNYQPGNCEVYAEEAAKLAKADKRLKGDMGKSFSKALTAYAGVLDDVVEAGMADTYAQSKAFGWDKATVDRKMKEGQDAVRAGFVGPTMEKNRFYTDHLMALNNCVEGSARAGHISADDMQAMGGLLGEVFTTIR